MIAYIIVGAALLLIIMGVVRHRKARNRALNIIEENCTGCQRCVKRCRQGALSVVDEKVVLNLTKCSACGNCVAVCKFEALKLTERKSK